MLCKQQGREAQPSRSTICVLVSLVIMIPGTGLSVDNPFTTSRCRTIIPKQAAIEPQVDLLVLVIQLFIAQVRRPGHVRLAGHLLRSPSLCPGHAWDSSIPGLKLYGKTPN
jgi:hypothetical protein